MDKPRIKINLSGKGNVTPAPPRWVCIRCGRDFPYPMVPNSCETALSLCVWCYAEDAVEFLDQADQTPPEPLP